MKASFFLSVNTQKIDWFFDFGEIKEREIERYVRECRRKMSLYLLFLFIGSCYFYVWLIIFPHNLNHSKFVVLVSLLSSNNKENELTQCGDRMLDVLHQSSKVGYKPLLLLYQI